MDTTDYGFTQESYLMKVEVELAKRMIKRSVPLYALVLVITLFISQEAFVTGIIASFTVTFVFLLNAYTQSYTAAISIKLYYFSSLFDTLFVLG